MSSRTYNKASLVEGSIEVQRRREVVLGRERLRTQIFDLVSIDSWRHFHEHGMYQALGGSKSASHQLIVDLLVELIASKGTF